MWLTVFQRAWRGCSRLLSQHKSFRWRLKLASQPTKQVQAESQTCLNHRHEAFYTTKQTKKDTKAQEGRFDNHPTVGCFLLRDRVRLACTGQPRNRKEPLGSIVRCAVAESGVEASTASRKRVADTLHLDQGTWRSKVGALRVTVDDAVTSLGHNGILIKKNSGLKTRFQRPILRRFGRQSET